jgi:hypothetical protein
VAKVAEGRGITTMYTGLLLGIILVIVIVLQLGYTSITRVYPLLALSYKVTAGKPLLRR